MVKLNEFITFLVVLIYCIQWDIQASMFWRKRIMEIASEYPDVELSHMYVDNAAMQLVRNPKQVRRLISIFPLFCDRNMDEWSKNLQLS